MSSSDGVEAAVSHQTGLAVDAANMVGVTRTVADETSALSKTKEACCRWIEKFRGEIAQILPGTLSRSHGSDS